MSFGFSVGDFLAAGKLIKDIISCLRDSSVSAFRELELELHGLQRALAEIEHLRDPSSEQASINGIKVAALMCQYPLDEFASKLKKFERLSMVNGNRNRKRDALWLWGRKLQWGFTMEDEVLKLRAYIVAHVGSLNMRLLTQGLTVAALTSERNAVDRLAVQLEFSKARDISADIQTRLDGHTVSLSGINTLLRKLLGFVSGELTDKLNALLDLANKIWRSNVRVMDLVAKIENNVPKPDIRHTWLQEPVRFEDALGRILPVPSEYSWGMLEAIIRELFKIGAGSEKVKAGEFELRDARNYTFTDDLLNSELAPGASITMSIILGRYGGLLPDCCPRSGCLSSRIAPTTSSSKVCLACHCTFTTTLRTIPRPHRPYTPLLTNVKLGRCSHKRYRGVLQAVGGASESYKRTVKDSAAFRNVSLQLEELPLTPRSVLARRSFGAPHTVRLRLRECAMTAVKPDRVPERSSDITTKRSHRDRNALSFQACEQNRKRIRNNDTDRILTDLEDSHDMKRARGNAIDVVISIPRYLILMDDQNLTKYLTPVAQTRGNTMQWMGDLESAVEFLHRQHLRHSNRQPPLLELEDTGSVASMRTDVVQVQVCPTSTQSTAYSAPAELDNPTGTVPSKTVNYIRELVKHSRRDLPFYRS